MEKYWIKLISILCSDPTSNNNWFNQKAFYKCLFKTTTEFKHYGLYLRKDRRKTKLQKQHSLSGLLFNQVVEFVTY